MNTSASSSAGTAAATGSASGNFLLDLFLTNIPMKLGILIAVGASILLGLVNTGTISTSNDTVKENYNLGGSLALISGVALLLYSFGVFQKIGAVASQSDTRRAIFSSILVLIVAIGIFLAIFWNYSSTSDTISLSTSILIMLVISVTLGALFKYSGQVPIANFITTMLFILYHFLPYAVFSFGILVDFFTRRIEFIGSSFAGVTAVLLNFTISRALSQGAPPPGMNPICEIPGLSTLSSDIAPQPMVFVVSSLAYIATYLTASAASGKGTPFQSGVISSWPPWTLLFGAWGLQYAMMGANECYGAKTKGGGATLFYKAMRGLVLSLAYGSTLGGIGYAVLKDRYQTPGASAPPPPPILGPGGTQTCPDGSTPGPDGQCPSASQQSQRLGTCAAGSGDGEFICESFENGKLKRRVITE